MPKIHLHWEVSTVLEGLRAARLPAARTQPAGNPKCNTARPAGARARRRSDRLTTLFAALNESVAGTNAKCQPHRGMSEFGGEAENICSHRVFRILTRCRHGCTIRTS